VGSYASTSDIAARLSGRTISTTSKPTTAQTSAWIDEAEAQIEGALASIGMTVPVASPARALVILRAWTLLYAEGHTRMAFASAGGDGTNDDGKDMLEQFYARLDFIRTNPTATESMLSDGSPGDSARRMRGYVTDNDDDKSIGNDDFLPTFEISRGSDQF
jgi:hypothetical protein